MKERRPFKEIAAETLFRAQALRLHRLLLQRRQAILLLYHRVSDEDDPFFPGLPREQFLAQLEYVGRSYRVEPLEQVVSWLSDGAEGPPRVAITIDDGYPDTLDIVLPELQRRGLPATLFLSTAPPETGVPLWIDRVRWLLKYARRPAFETTLHGLSGLSLGSTESRLGALTVLLRRLKSLGPADIQSTVCALEQSLDADGPLPRVLGWEDVRRIAAGPIRLGAHTHHHFVLSRLTDGEQESEVGGSLQLIRERTGTRVTSFAYPNGQPEDYDGRAIALLRRLGLQCALTTRDGPARPGSDPFQLPRIHTTAPSIALFAARLAGLSPDGSEEGPIE